MKKIILLKQLILLITIQSNIYCASRLAPRYVLRPPNFYNRLSSSHRFFNSKAPSTRVPIIFFRQALRLRKHQNEVQKRKVASIIEENKFNECAKKLGLTEQQKRLILQGNYIKYLEEDEKAQYSDAQEIENKIYALSVESLELLRDHLEKN